MGITNLCPKGLLYLMPASKKYLSGIPMLHKYNFPQVCCEILFKGKIGRIEHFIDTSKIPDDGGSIASIEERFSEIHFFKFGDKLLELTESITRSEDGKSLIECEILFPVALNSSNSTFSFSVFSDSFLNTTSLLSHVKLIAFLLLLQFH